MALDRLSDEIVFVEVKTRKNSDFGFASNAVDQRKIKNMKEVAKHYLQKFDLNKDYRFDIITVVKDKIEHFENITWL